MGTPKVLEPGQVNTEDAARAMRRIRDYLVRHPGDADVDVTSELADDGPLILPRAVVVMLASMLAQLDEGRGVTLMPSHAELTTVEAASMLNVSRPYLIKLIDIESCRHGLSGGTAASASVTSSTTSAGQMPPRTRQPTT
jgi:hypothetical protein